MTPRLWYKSWQQGRDVVTEAAKTMPVGSPCRYVAQAAQAYQMLLTDAETALTQIAEAAVNEDPPQALATIRAVLVSLGYIGTDTP